MKRILDFITANKYAIIWTVCYIFATWAILYFMFHFSIFNGAQWHKLMHAQLRGFPGFVFGILILAMIPLYVATTTLIIRTKKPLITIPVPKIIQAKKPAPAPDADPAPTTEPTEKKPELPNDIPDEIRPQFIRAIRNIELFSAYTQKPVATQSPAAQPEKSPVPQVDTPAPKTLESDDLPIPEDFDISFDDTFSNMPSFDIPVFSDVNFDNTTKDDTSVDNTSQPNEEIMHYLKSNGTDFTTTNDIIITDKHAIIAHTDNDFWVTDPDNWFATGKTRPSPIASVIAMANEHKVTPVLYLSAQNILDLETLIPEWESNGIKVITDLSEI